MFYEYPQAYYPITTAGNIKKLAREKEKNKAITTDVGLLQPIIVLINIHLSKSFTALCIDHLYSILFGQALIRC